MARAFRWALIFALGLSFGMIAAQTLTTADRADRFAQSEERVECCTKLGLILYGVEDAMTEAGPFREGEPESRTRARGVMEAALANAGFDCGWKAIANPDGSAAVLWKCVTP